MFDRIMVLSDLTDTTEFAFKALDRLANRQSRVVLYHATIGATDQFYLADELRKTLNVRARRKARAAMDAYKEAIESRGLEVEAVVDVGSTYDNLPGAIARYDIDLVVIPTRIQHSLIRGVSNSVTARAIRTHAAPVLIVNQTFGESEGAWDGFNRLMHPVAFGPDHMHGIAAAESLAAKLGSDLHLVHAMRTLELDDFSQEFDEELGFAFRQDDMIAKAKARLEQKRAAVEGVTAHGDVFETESVATGLCQWATDQNMGGIVLPGVGQDRTRSMILGSVAEYLLKHAPCPVFICEKPLS